MVAWLESLVNYLAPIQSDFGKIGIISLQRNLKHRPYQPSHILNYVCHVRDERECLDRDLAEITFKQDKNLGICLTIAGLLNFNNLYILAQALELLLLLCPGLKLLKFAGLREMVEEEFFSNLWSQIRHEIGHGLTIDIVVASNATHVCCKDPVCLLIVPDQLHSVQSFNAFGDELQENSMACRVLLIMLYRIGLRTLLDSLEEEGFFEPLDSFCNCCNGTG